jgi:hypothetical protein
MLYLSRQIKITNKSLSQCTAAIKEHVLFAWEKKDEAETQDAIAETFDLGLNNIANFDELFPHMSTLFVLF